MKKFITLLCIMLVGFAIKGPILSGAPVCTAPSCQAPCPPPSTPSCAPCGPCAPCAPCASICGTECGVSLCAIGVAVLAIVAAGAIILSSSQPENAH